MRRQLKQRFSVWRRNPESKLRLARFVETRGARVQGFMHRLNP